MQPSSSALEHRLSVEEGVQEHVEVEGGAVARRLGVERPGPWNDTGVIRVVGS